jgi:Uma2 family endonuclease
MLPLLRQSELQNGDRMSRDEFMSRWEQIPELKQAELIEGVVYLASLVSLPHGSYDSLLGAWLGYYAHATRINFVIAANTTLLLGDSVYQPDVALVSPRERTGAKYLDQLPDLVVEISYSSRSYDLGPKLNAYRLAGLREYITVLLEEQRVEWRVLSGSRYRVINSAKDGMLRSPHLPGLWLDTAALFPPDRTRLFSAIDLGLSPG